MENKKLLLLGILLGSSYLNAIDHKIEFDPKFGVQLFTLEERDRSVQANFIREIQGGLTEKAAEKVIDGFVSKGSLVGWTDADGKDYNISKRAFAKFVAGIALRAAEIKRTPVGKNLSASRVATRIGGELLYSFVRSLALDEVKNRIINPLVSPLHNLVPKGITENKAIKKVGSLSYAALLNLGYDRAFNFATGC